MRYLILGASGFIGKSLVRTLNQNGNTLRLFDRIIPDVKGVGVEYVEGMFSKQMNFDLLTKDIDVVYHLISTTIPSSKTALDDEVDQNVVATIKLLESCVSNDVKKFIFISSGGTVYGKGQGLPFKEDDETNPISSYGIQKLTIEKYIQLFYYRNQLDYRIIRLANPYGVGQNPFGNLGVVTKFTYNVIHDEAIDLFGNGDIIRDYIYIDDAIQGIVDIEHSKCKDKLFNLGMGRGHSVKEIMDTVEKVSEKTLKVNRHPARNNDVPYSVLDIHRFSKVTSIKKMISLEDGIKRLLRDFESENEK